jgi:hypothetical protein
VLETVATQVGVLPIPLDGYRRAMDAMQRDRLFDHLAGDGRLRTTALRHVARTVVSTSPHVQIRKHTSLHRAVLSPFLRILNEVFYGRSPSNFNRAAFLLLNVGHFRQEFEDSLAGVELAEQALTMALANRAPWQGSCPPFGTTSAYSLASSLA